MAIEGSCSIAANFCQGTNEHGKTGYIVPLLDVDELVGKTLELLGDSRKRQAFAEAGKARLNADMKQARKSWEELIAQTGGADEA